MMRTAIIGSLLLFAVSAGAQSNAPVAKPAAAAKPASAATPVATPTPHAASAATPATPGAPAASGPAAVPDAPVGFTYRPEGRRDPFVSLARRGTDTRAVGPRPAGLAGLEVSEVVLRGTLRTRNGFVAMLQGADQKTYTVRPGDKLFDGTVNSITQSDLTILQQVNDPLSLDKQREVRKGLRQVEAN